MQLLKSAVIRARWRPPTLDPDSSATDDWLHGLSCTPMLDSIQKKEETISTASAGAADRHLVRPWTDWDV